MSITQNEVDVVRDGRKNKLGEEAKASLRDQSIKKLQTKLEEEHLGIAISKAWDTASTSVGAMLERQQALLADLDNFCASDNLPNNFGGMSNIHLPVAFTVIKSYHARFLEALLGVDPPFSMKARREEGTDRVVVAEDLMRYTLKNWCNEYRGIDDTVDQWIWDWCSTGTGIMKIRWKTLWERFTDVKDVAVPTTPMEQVDISGNLIMVPQWRMEEVEEEVTEKIFEGPQYDVINMEDFRMIGGNGDPDLADMVMHRTYLTASELWTGVDRAVYDEDTVESMINGGKDDPLWGGINSNIKQQRKLNAGETTYTDDTHLDRYEVIEACLKYDVDGSGITTEIVVLIEKRTSKILSCTYLRRIMRTGERPYSVAHFHKRKGEQFGLGLLEILNPLTTELDTMHNIRIDNALFESTPFYIYRNTASFDPESVVIEPGVGIGVDTMDDIMFPQFPNRTGFTAQEEGTIQQYIERLTGISDLSLGIVSSTQGAARTASGVRAIMGENNSNLSVHLRRLNAGWTKVLKTTWHLLQDRVPAGFTFRITGDDGGDIFRKVENTELQLDADFEVSSNTANSNKSVQIELGQLLVQTTSNPLYIQMGLTNTQHIYAALKNYFNNLGVKDFHRYFQRPAEYQPSLSPQEEFARVIRGEQVPVTPEQDHNGFIAFVQSMLEQQQKPGGAILTNEQFMRAIDQLKQHQQMMAALQAQAAQVANQQQVFTNMQGAPGGSPQYTNQANDYGSVF